jgi:hypothetical protein
MKIPLNGELVSAHRMEVVKSDEKISEYLLKNGTILRIRTVLTGVFQFEDKKDDCGNPIYHVNWHVISTTEPGE